MEQKPGTVAYVNIERLGVLLWKYKNLALLLAETVLKVVMHSIFLIKIESQSSIGKDLNNVLFEYKYLVGI